MEQSEIVDNAYRNGIEATRKLQTAEQKEMGQYMTPPIEDREAQAFRKNFSKLAVGSLVWFRTEPELIVLLSNQKLKDL